MKIRFISDLHYTLLEDVKSQAYQSHEAYIRTVLDALFSQEADIYMSTGDLVNLGSLDEISQIYNWIEAYDKPFHHILGNHDLLRLGRKEWPQTFYKGNIHKSYEGFHLIYLETAREKNAEDYSGYIDQETGDWLAKSLEKTDQDPVLLFGHHPVYDTSRRSTIDKMHVLPEYQLAEKMAVKQGPAFYIHGHNHCDSITFQDNWTYIQAACELEHPAIQEIEISKEGLTYQSKSIENTQLAQWRADFIDDLPAFAKVENSLGTKLEKNLQLKF